MLCPSCDKTMEPGWLTCPFCSSSLNEEEVPAEPASDSSEPKKSTRGHADPVARGSAFLIDTAIVGVLVTLITPIAAPFYESIPGGALSLREAFRVSETGIDLSFFTQYGNVETFGHFLLLVTGIVLYHGLFEGSSRQATPGKIIFGIRVTDNAGYPLGYSRGFIRALARIPSLIAGMFSILCYFLTDGKALHDFFPGSVVRG